MSEVLFRTIHGSQLYNLAHGGSDTDIFEVTTSTRPKARHSYNDVTGIDTCSMGLDVFMVRIFEGSHQSVEALFSPLKIWTELGLRYRPMLDGYRIYGEDVFAKYERTIKRFCFGDFKRRRHAVRLAWNLEDMRAIGTFNPQMTPADVWMANHLAESLDGNELWTRLTR